MPERFPSDRSGDRHPGPAADQLASRPADGPGSTSTTGVAAVHAAARSLAGDAARVAAARRLQPWARPAQGSTPESTGGPAAGHGDEAVAAPGLDRLAALAARMLGVPAAQVSLLSDVQTIPAAAGLPPQARAGNSPLADSLCTVTAAAGEPVLVADAVTDERVAGLPPVLSGAVGAYLGVPLTGQDGHVVGALCVFGPDPRDWSSTDVTVLADLATAAVSELELAALSVEYEAARLRWELSIGAAGVGGFDLDLLTGRLSWDERLIELFGYQRGGFDESLDAFNARLHPEDLPRVSQALSECIAGCGELEMEYRVIRPDGSTRWVKARGTALDAHGAHQGVAVRVLGAAYDTTAEREEDVRIARVLENMSTAFFSLDTDWRFSYVNAEAERVLGRSRAELLGGNVWQLFPEAVGAAFDVEYHRAADTGETVSFEAYYPAPLDAWYEVRAWPSPDGLSVYFLDITARRCAQQTAERAQHDAEVANAGLQLLASTSRQLAETLEAEQAVSRLAELVVPTLGDWCVITLVEDDAPVSAPDPARDRTRTAAGRSAQWRRGLRDASSWHHDEALRPLVQRYADLRLDELTDGAFLWRALRQAHPVAIADATRAISAVLAPDGAAHEVLAELAPTSAVVFPLRGRGRTVGLMTLFAGPGRAPLSERETTFAAEVADRAGLALDSARLYRQQRDLAATLQRSLLTDPPEPDHGQIVVRYLPAAEAAQVGGDWYDAFVQPDGATVLVIGDVIGHDTQAAAAMSQVRTTLRTIGALGDDSPARVLAQTDRALANLQVGTTATAIAARLEQTPDERERGVTRLRWSNAGHPPAMIVNPDATITPLLGLHADLLLGVLPGTERRDSEVVLDRGATVILYTDGLVERRDQPLGEGLEKLQQVLQDLAARDDDLDTLVDQVLAAMLPSAPDDDVAVIAIRLHRQDRPRPAEAGPRRVPPHVPPEPSGTPDPGNASP